jgi:hypothetical protein
MFNWFSKKKVNDTKVVNKTEAEMFAERVEKANFVEEDGVSCLFQKVCNELEMNYIKWQFTLDNTSFVYKNEESKIKVTYNYNQYGGTYYWDDLATYHGALKIGDVSFNLNHDSCTKFKELWKSVEEKITQEKKNHVLKQWGCK